MRPQVSARRLPAARLGRNLRKVTVDVHYFGSVRETAGLKVEQLELSKGGTVDDLIAQVIIMHPGIAALRRLLRVIVNGTVVNHRLALRDGDMVAVVPPTAGG